MAALVCALLVWEVLLECLVVRSPGSVEHPVLGSIPARGILVNGQEGYGIAHINSLGMRGPEIGRRQAGEYRILTLGDSFTQAVQVGDEQTFCCRLQRALAAKTRLPIRVVNGGRDGGSPAYYIHLAPFYQRVIHPDYVIVQLDDGDFTSDILNPQKTFYAVPDNGTFKTVKNAAVRNDSLLSRQAARFSVLKHLSMLRVANERFQAALHSLCGGQADEDDSTAPLSPLQREALDWAIRTLRDRYPRVILLYIPTLLYDHLNQPPPEVETLLAAATRRWHVDYINLRDDFVQDFRAHHQPLHGFDNTLPGFGHINSRGHLLAARRLAAYFEGKIGR
jgi:hypothetical protein